MIDFVNILEFNNHNYQLNGTVRDDHYKGRLLFTMIKFVLFGTDRQ